MPKGNEMSQAGIGVMLGALFGDRGGEKLQAAIGKTIAAIEVGESALRLAFDDATAITLRDNGQSCCEHRYMRTDDDTAAFVGAQFTGAELKDAPGTEAEWGEVHECQFLEIQTSRGVFTIVNHNEHNGYYGGFWIVVE